MTRGIKLTLQDLEALAEARGGSSLSETCNGSFQKHLWRCSEGHEWDATPVSIHQGRWCPTCSRLRRRLTLESLRHLAHERGGELLSETYQGALKPLQWRCRKNHVWDSTPNHVKCGTWCPICASQRQCNSDLQVMAAQRGGIYLSSTFNGERKIHHWSCSLGHVWEASPRQVRAGIWCPECRRRHAGPAIEPRIAD